MTDLQKEIIRKLFAGGNIARNGQYGYRLRDEKQNAVASFGYKTFFRIKDLLRKKDKCFVIDKRKVRQLHGRHFAKKLYKRLAIKGELCEPCTYDVPGKVKKKAPVTVLHDIPKPQLQIF